MWFGKHHLVALLVSLKIGTRTAPPSLLNDVPGKSVMCTCWWVVGWCGRADCWAVITKANWWPEQTERITLGPGLILRCTALYLVSF